MSCIGSVTLLLSCANLASYLINIRMSKLQSEYRSGRLRVSRLSEIGDREKLEVGEVKGVGDKEK